MKQRLLFAVSFCAALAAGYSGAWADDSSEPAVPSSPPAAAAPVAAPSPDPAASAAPYPALVSSTLLPGKIIEVRGLSGSAGRQIVAGQATGQVAATTAKTVAGAAGIGFVADLFAQTAADADRNRKCQIDVQLEDGSTVTAEQWCAYLKSWKLYTGAAAKVRFTPVTTILYHP